MLGDYNSANGTFHNGTRLEADQQVELVPGDELRFGALKAQFADSTRLCNMLKTSFPKERMGDLGADPIRLDPMAAPEVCRGDGGDDYTLEELERLHEKIG